MQAMLASSEEMDLASAQRNKGDERLHVRFSMGSVQDEVASKAEGRPIFRDVPFVEIWTPGDDTTVIKRAAWLDAHHPQSDINRFRKQWAAFEAGQSQDVVSGTPIDKLPGITEGQVRELQHFRVRTIEHLADLADTAAQNFMGINVLRQRARDWLEAARGAAPLEAAKAALAERDNRIEALEQMLRAQGERLDALAAETPKRGPGRPPKVHTEA